jgi:hypothetical protein
MNNMSVTLNQGLRNYQESVTHKIGSLNVTINLCSSAKYSKINANLTKNRFGHLKVGKMGIKNIIRELYKELGYENLQDGIGYILDFGMEFIS